MNQIKLNIETKTQKYPIYIGKKLSANISKITKSNSINFNRCLLVVDSNVPKKFIIIRVWGSGGGDGTLWRRYIYMYIG